MSANNAHVRVDVTLEQLITDQKVPIDYTFFRRCKTCGGNKVLIDWQGKSPCRYCQGLGGHHMKDQFTMTLQPGGFDINGGQCLVKGRGHLIDGKKGDLIVDYTVKPHPLFRPDGKDLVCDIAISPLQAMFGGEIEFPSLTGSAKRFAENPHEEDWKIKGGGGYRYGDMERGNLRYRFITAESNNPTEQRAVSRIQQMKASLIDFLPALKDGDSLITHRTLQPTT